MSVLMKTHKKKSFFAMGPVSSALVCTSGAATRDVPAPMAKGAFSAEEDKDETKEHQSQKPAAVSSIVDEFFWIGSSIVAFSKWRLGYTGTFWPGRH